MAHRVQARQEELFFQQPLRQELFLAPVQTQNFAGGVTAQRQVAIAMPQDPIEARELAVNNAMFAQMLQLVYQMGQDSKGSDEEAHRLTLENRELNQHLIQRIDALENKWIGAAELLCAKVDVIYLKLNKLDKELTAEHEEARRVHDIEMKCVIDGKTWDYDALKRAFGKGPGRGFTIPGAAEATVSIYSDYLSFYPKVDRDAWEQLHLSVRDSLKALVRAEVQKMKVEMVPDELIDEDENGLQPIAAFNSNDLSLIDVGAVFHAFTQRRQEEIQTRDVRNAALRKKNEGLTGKKNELETMDKRFLGLFHTHLYYSCSNLKQKMEGLVKRYRSTIKDYPRHLEELCDWMKLHSRPAGCYKKGIELSDKIISSVHEILPLVESLQKEISL
jgi:hypothetical protein